MNKVLYISGSPRKGNTEYVFNELVKQTENNELVLLRNKEIKHCVGCMKCKDGKGSCVIRDDMDAIMQKIKESELIVVGSPNYYDNTSGLLRDFIDRTHPFYSSKEIGGKKFIFIFVGGGETKGTDKHMRLAVHGMVKYLKLNVINYYSFKALNSTDLSDQDTEDQINGIVEEIKDNS